MLALVTLSGLAQTKKKATTAVEQISITAEATLNPQQKVTAHMKAGSYEGPIGIKLRGNSSLSFNQKKYTIELRDESGKDVEASLLGMPAHSDWVLLAPYNDVSAVRDPLAFQLWRDMGHWAPRTRMVELTLNGDYRGIYILSEAIKRDSMRVDIAKLKKSDIAGRDVTGGYILRIDTYDEEDATFPSKVPGIGEEIMTSQITWSCIYPKKKKLQPEQLAYIEQFVDSMELAIQSDDFANPQRGYAHFIDVPSFVDYFIHTELSLNADGYKRSAYFYKEKLHADGTGGKLVAGPVWDYNLAYGNCNFCNANNPEAWCFEGGNTQPTPAFWQRLLQDPAFRKAVKMRYKALRKGVLSNKAINSYIDQHAKLLAPYIARHFEKYPELLVSEKEKGQTPTPPAFSFPPMGDFHMPEGFKMPDSIPLPEGFKMPDSIPNFPGGFPPMGRFPMMGGFHMSDSIPLKFMEEQGCDKIIVIETQPIDYVKKPQKYMGLIKLMLHKYPKMIATMADRHNMYNNQKAYIKSREESGNVFVIRPDAPLNIGATEKNPDELQRVYEVGRRIAMDNLEALKNYLK